ncbi:hypothetical protein PybrP1_011278 [[Pythium] brassicae (nom. inval.)]|nr:hypothetical protein PybrP1_011278 [[Pythium] brassicae (nom. inval.)]
MSKHEREIRVALSVEAASFFVALVAPQHLPVQLRSAFRRERDVGLVVGCTLVPLVLLSRLAMDLYHHESFSGFTFFYAWTSVTIGISAFVRLVLLRSPSFAVALAVDCALLPALEHAVALAGGPSHAVVTAACRCLASLVLSFGVRALPRSFTLGEALLVAQGVAMNAFDLGVYSARRLQAKGVAAGARLLGLEQWGVDAVERDDYVLALQLGLTGSLLVCVSLAPLLRTHGVGSPSIVAPPLGGPQCASFALRSLGVVGAVVYPWSCLVLETANPLAWLVSFLRSRASRAGLVVYWVACLAVLVPLFALAVDRLAIRTIVARKLFHALVVLMFVPAYFADAPMLALSYGVALSVFCLVECVRALSLPPAGRHIAAFMKTFIDRRDAGRAVLTHSYLLLGCALPLWLSLPSGPAAGPNSPASALTANAGILALGVGDAMGAVVGSSYGRRRLIGSKTLEGALAVIVSMALASLCFHDFHVEFLVHGRFGQLALFVAAVALTSILETCTSQIDNLVLPLYFFATCSLVACHRGV